MSYVLAVDGGNTKTIALVAAIDGTILGAGRGGCGDIYQSAPDLPSPLLALTSIENAVSVALDAAHISLSELLVGVFNLAGADWPEDYALLQTAMQEHGYGSTVLIQNDALGVLHSGSQNNVGVSVVCGTGSAIGARGPDGKTWHSSFWQWGVEGSHQLSEKTLKAVIHSELGIVPSTSLTGRVLTFLHLHSVEELLYRMTSRTYRGGRRLPLGALTPLLLDEAEGGDLVARQIVREHGQALGNFASFATRHVGLEGQAFPLVLAGGVLRHPSSLLADAITERVRETAPAVEARRSRFEPVVGTLFSALEAAGVSLDERVMERLIPTIPGADLFDTIPPPP